ncbi:MAG: protein arginine kinase [Phycisphaerae bacterium]|nr:protein arginine kinase [Phycisphaerae bacterium]
MNPLLKQMLRQAGEWMRGVGPMHEIVISTRIRLARNLDSYPFLTRATAETRLEIADAVTHAIKKSPELKNFVVLDLEKLDEIERNLLVERHLISRQQAESDGVRRVALVEAEDAAVMINEEDHLRLQVFRSGLQLDAAWEQINRLDDLLAEKVSFAFHPKYGYLTACPTNVGTGIRVSVMLHLPALRLTNEIEKVGHAAKTLKLAVRGLHGEGTEALGDFFQISNQVTLGISEERIIRDFTSDIIPKIVKFEQAARDALVAKRPEALDDKVWRAMGILRNSRLLSSSEALQCLSHVRMGVHAGRIDDIDVGTINELFLQTQPAHLQKICGEKMTGEQRSIARAQHIRERLSRN